MQAVVPKNKNKYNIYTSSIYQKKSTTNMLIKKQIFKVVEKFVFKYIFKKISLRVRKDSRFQLKA